MKSALRIACLITLLGMSTAVPAAILFQDNFDTETPGNNEPLSQWNLFSNGTTDTLNHSPIGIQCVGGAGRCIDLDGSSQDAANLISNTLFQLVAGVRYQLSYDLSGN
jgi:hypothetical protein